MTAQMLTQDLLRAQLAALDPVACELSDDSHRHAGHASAKEGGHYTLKIVSAAFTGKSALARHRMVYAAVGVLMQGSVHALSITALSPEESVQAPSAPV